MIKSAFFSFCFLISGLLATSQTKVEDSILSKTLQFRTKSKSENYNLDQRLKYANKSLEYAKKTGKDTTILLSGRALASVYLALDSLKLNAKINKFNLMLARKLKDSLTEAYIQENLGANYQLRAQNDSAFYYYSKALKYYRLTNNIRFQADVLRNIAYVQENEGDYISCEKNAIEAIKLYKQFKVDDIILDDLWILNNTIAALSKELKQYDKSLEYHNYALEFAKKLKTRIGFWNELYTLNNMCTVYREKGNFSKAIELYKDVLKKGKNFDEDYSFYAIINHNIAYTKTLRGDVINKGIIDAIKKSYKISDSLQDPIVKSAIGVELAKVYFKKREIDSALYYARTSKDLALQVSNNEYLLEAYMLLSELEDGEVGKKYLRDHINLNDSLVQVERAVRNKFARIEYETEQIEQENKEISEQRKWLMILSGVLLITLFLLYIIITQRNKNKELKFVQQQQEANEEIYNLMLSQQDKIDDARAAEKKRISQELHDGVLGRLFGTRLSLDSLNMNPSEEAIKTRSQYIDQLKDIEQDIRKVSHDLNTDFVSGSGFLDIITTLIETQTKAYGLNFELYHSDDINWDLVPNKTKIHIYRMLQESLQNIYKHANASKVEISFDKKKDVICLTVEDNGSGFDINKARKGIGIKNFNSRVKEINGKLNIDSEIDKGTIIEVSVPV